MTGWVFIAVGGALGSISRYETGRLLQKHTGGGLPLGTLAVNATGAFLLGLLVGSGVSGSWYALLGDGFLGAFTTFSTFMYEGFSLIRGGKGLNAAAYICLTLLLGGVGYTAGVLAGTLLTG